MKLSIIIPTLNRFEQLRVCIKSLRLFEPTVSHEIIVIDGDSIDGTREWLFFQRDLIVLQHNQRTGCVKAFNDGFAISQGEYCAQLSDDVRLTDDCLDAACKLLDERPNLGQVVIRHLQDNRMQSPMFKTLCGSWLFAAFGVTRRELGDEVGWWGDYYHQQGDVELGIKIYTLGYDIEIVPDKYLLHEPGSSEFRSYSEDRKKFDGRWRNWEKPRNGGNRHLQRGNVNWRALICYNLSRAGS